MLQKLLNKWGRDDYFFIVEPKSEYNTTRKHELHNIDSEAPILVGFWRILRALIVDQLMIKYFS